MPETSSEFQRQMGVGWVNPRTGKPMTEDEIREHHRKKGNCPMCGRVKTHEKRFHITGYAMEPLTIPGKVLNGKCLDCESVQHSPSHQDSHKVYPPTRRRRRRVRRQMAATNAMTTFDEGRRIMGDIDGVRNHQHHEDSILFNSHSSSASASESASSTRSVASSSRLTSSLDGPSSSQGVSQSSLMSAPDATTEALSSSMNKAVEEERHRARRHSDELNSSRLSASAPPASLTSSDLTANHDCGFTRVAASGSNVSTSGTVSGSNVSNFGVEKTAKKCHRNAFVRDDRKVAPVMMADGSRTTESSPAASAVFVASSAGDDGAGPRGEECPGRNPPLYAEATAMISDASGSGGTAVAASNEARSGFDDGCGEVTPATSLAKPLSSSSRRRRPSVAEDRALRILEGKSNLQLGGSVKPCSIVEVVGAMRGHPDSFEVQEAACKRLRNYFLPHAHSAGGTAAGNTVASGIAMEDDGDDGGDGEGDGEGRGGNDEGVVGNVCDDHEWMSLPENIDALMEAIASAMTRHPDRRKVREEGCGAIWTVCCHCCSSVAAGVGSSGVRATSKLVKCIRRTIREGSQVDIIDGMEGVQFGLGCLAALAMQPGIVGEENRRVMDEWDCMGAVLREMRSYRGISLLLQEWACRALSVLRVGVDCDKEDGSGDDGERVTAAKTTTRVINEIAASTREYLSDETLVRWACRALRNAVASAPVGHPLTLAAVDDVMKLMGEITRAHPNAGPVTAEVLAVLSACHAKTKSSMKTELDVDCEGRFHDVFDRVLEALVIFPGETDVQRTACSLLLLFMDGMEPVLAAQTVRAVIHGMRADNADATQENENEKNVDTIKNAAVQEMRCHLLLRMSLQSDENKEVVLSEGGVSAVAGLIRLHAGKVVDGGERPGIAPSSAKNLMSLACGLLVSLSLSLSEPGLREIEESGALEAFAQMVANGNSSNWASKNGGLFFAMCGVAVRVLEARTARRHIPANFVKAVVAVMGAHVTAEEVQRRGISFIAWSFSRCGDDDEERFAVRSSCGAINAVLRAMEANAHCLTVLSRGCVALAILSTPTQPSTSNVSSSETTIASTNEFDASLFSEAIKIAITAHPDNEGLVQSGMLALRNLHLIKRREDAMESIMDFLTEQHGSSVVVCKHALGVLWSLSSATAASSEGKPLLWSPPWTLEEGAEAVARAMKKYHPVLQKEGCNILWNLLCCEAAERDVATGAAGTGILASTVSPFVVRSVVDALSGCTPDDENDCVTIQKRALGLLSLFSADFNFRVIVAALEPHRNVISAMAGNPTERSLVRDGCSILYDLASLEPPETAVKIVNDGGVDVVVDAMRDHCNDTEIQISGCNLLQFMSEMEQQQRSLSSSLADRVETCVMQTDAVRGVVRALRTHMNSMSVQRKGIDFLRALATKDKKYKLVIAQAGGIEATVDTMTRHVRVAEIQEKGSFLLWTLAIIPELQTAVGLAGGVAAIVNGMVSHVLRPSVQEAGLGALITFALESTNRRSILQSGGSSAVIHAMRVHYQNPSLQVQGCHALSNIVAESEETYRDRGIMAEEIDAIVGAMFMHGDTPDVQLAGCIALMNYSCHPFYLQVLRANHHLKQVLINASCEFADCRDRAQAVLESCGFFWC